MKEHKKIIFVVFYLALMAAFILWLTCSNFIIISIRGASKLETIDFEESLFKDDIYYGIDTIEVMNNLTECIDITGWAYVETEVDNSNKSVSIILEGDDICYQADCKIFPKASMRKMFSQHRILGKMHGFMSDISTIGMKDGVYDLYIYCKENEENYGISNADYGASNVGIQIEKRGSTLIYYPWKAEQRSELLNPSRSEAVVGAVDSAGVEDDRLNIWGWAFAEGQDCAAQTVYLELTDEQGGARQYTTKSAVRDSVAQEYKSALYQKSGYRTSIPVEEIDDGTYTMRAILENDGEVWASQAYRLTKQGDAVQLGSPGPETNEIAFDDSFFKDTVYYGLDHIGTGGQETETLAVSGWAYAETQQDNAEKTVSVILRGAHRSYQTECTLFERPEIPSLFPERQIMGDTVGFSTDIAAASIEDGVYDVYIYCEENKENYGAANADYGASNTGYQVEKRGDAISCYPWKAEQRSGLLDTPQSKAATGAVDFAGAEGNCISIWGWAFAEGQDSAAQAVYVELTDEHGTAVQYTTKSAVRDGVVAEYKSELYTKSGYRTLIPAENLADGTYTLRALVVIGDEVWETGACTLVRSGNSIGLQR